MHPHSRCAIVIGIAGPLEGLPREWSQGVVAVAQGVLRVEGVLCLQAQTCSHVFRLPLALRVVLVGLKLIRRPHRLACVLGVDVTRPVGAVEVVPVLRLLALRCSRW
eukprot:1161909-Pelagomonas_calceolata.AAC.18